MQSSEPLPSSVEDSTAADSEFAHRYDDPEDPSELTIFAPESQKLTTEWITADRSTAVALDQFQ